MGRAVDTELATFLLAVQQRLRLFYRVKTDSEYLRWRWENDADLRWAMRQWRLGGYQHRDAPIPFFPGEDRDLDGMYFVPRHIARLLTKEGESDAAS